MTDAINITDLSKDELLELISIRGFQFSIKDRDIKRVRWNTLTRRGHRMMDEACEDMKKYHGPQNYRKYKEQMDKFDSGMALIDEAEKFITSG